MLVKPSTRRGAARRRGVNARDPTNCLPIVVTGFFVSLSDGAGEETRGWNAFIPATPNLLMC